MNHSHRDPDRSPHQLAKQRRGAAAVFGVFLTISLIALMAFSLDFGRINVAQTEMRRTTDAAAMAACWEMYDRQSAGDSHWQVRYKSYLEANDVAALNTVGSNPLHVSYHDIEVGHYDVVTGSFDNTSTTNNNAVEVTLRQQDGVNGELPLFFGGLTGRETQSLKRTAIAAMLSTVVGFKTPSNGDTLGIMPIALDEPSWDAAVAGQTEDDWAFVNGSLQSGSDGIFETNLYPKGNGSPGNRGTVDIGGANNSTSDLSRQILHGVSEQDMMDLGKPLTFDANGELELNGDTGISAGIKDELASLIGKTRIIPIFSSVSGNGNNAMYTIVRFEGVRILDVKLTGKKNQKRVIVQPATVLARNAILDFEGTSTSSTHLVAPVMLVD